LGLTKLYRYWWRSKIASQLTIEGAKRGLTVVSSQSHILVAMSRTQEHGFLRQKVWFEALFQSTQAIQHP
jgi:hypothetical protein